MQGWIERPAGDGITAAIMLAPGIAAGTPGLLTEQTLREVVLTRGPVDLSWRGDAPAAWGDLSPAAASELIRDLRVLTG